MTSARVLVTGIGGQPGFDLARRLHQLGAAVIGVDADPLANGMLINGIQPQLCPHVTDPRYGDALVTLCGTEAVDAVAPTVESELPVLIDLADDLAAVGARTWLPTHRSVEACLDKAVFAQVLAEAGIAHPATWLPGQLDDAPANGERYKVPKRFVVLDEIPRNASGKVLRAKLLAVAES